MSRPDYHLHGGRAGAAVAVRVIPRAMNDEIAEVLADGSVKIRLKSPPEDDLLNKSLIAFLASVLGVPASRIEIVGGQSRRRKLVSILDLDAAAAHAKILENLA